MFLPSRTRITLYIDSIEKQTLHCTHLEQGHAHCDIKVLRTTEVVLIKLQKERKKKKNAMATGSLNVSSSYTVLTVSAAIPNNAAFYSQCYWNWPWGFPNRSVWTSTSEKGMGEYSRRLIGKLSRVKKDKRSKYFWFQAFSFLVKKAWVWPENYRSIQPPAHEVSFHTPLDATGSNNLTLPSHTLRKL